MTKELDSLRVDLERVIEEHEPEIAAAMGVAANVVPNPAIDALLAELDDVVGRLHAAAKPPDPTPPASAGTSTDASTDATSPAGAPADPIPPSAIADPATVQ